MVCAISTSAGEIAQNVLGNDVDVTWVQWTVYSGLYTVYVVYSIQWSRIRQKGTKYASVSPGKQSTLEVCDKEASWNCSDDCDNCSMVKTIMQTEGHITHKYKSPRTERWTKNRVAHGTHEPTHTQADRLRNSAYSQTHARQSTSAA